VLQADSISINIRLAWHGGMASLCGGFDMGW
jgi:hypothetical protein